MQCISPHPPILFRRGASKCRWRCIQPPGSEPPNFVQHIFIPEVITESIASEDEDIVGAYWDSKCLRLVTVDVWWGGRSMRGLWVLGFRLRVG